jgi:hypothetical protein
VEGSVVFEDNVPGVSGGVGRGEGLVDHFDGDGDEGLGIVVSSGFGGGLLGAEASGVFVESC